MSQRGLGFQYAIAFVSCTRGVFPSSTTPYDFKKKIMSQCGTIGQPGQFGLGRVMDSQHARIPYFRGGEIIYKEIMICSEGFDTGLLVNPTSYQEIQAGG